MKIKTLISNKKCKEGNNINIIIEYVIKHMIYNAMNSDYINVNNIISLLIANLASSLKKLVRNFNFSNYLISIIFNILHACESYSLFRKNKIKLSTECVDYHS